MTLVNIAFTNALGNAVSGTLTVTSTAAAAVGPNQSVMLPLKVTIPSGTTQITLTPTTTTGTPYYLEFTATGATTPAWKGWASVPNSATAVNLIDIVKPSTVNLDVAGFSYEGLFQRLQTDPRVAQLFGGGGGGSGSGVIAFNGRQGLVLPAANDYTSDQVAEGSNLYFTSARARAAVSANAPLTYNSTTGAFGWSGNSDQVPEGSTNLYYTPGRARTAISVSGDLSYNSATGVISYTTPPGNGVLSFKGRSGAVVPTAGDYTSDQVTEGATNLFFTQSRARSSLSASGPLSYNATTGAFTFTGAYGVSSFNGRTGAISPAAGDYTASQVGAIATTALGQPNGPASLGADGKLPSSQLPALATTETYVVNTQTAMLALGAQAGDIAVRTDVSTTYILQGSDPTVLSNWVQLLSPGGSGGGGGVTTFNGRTGTVVPASGDYTSDQVTEGSVNLYSTAARIRAALSGTAPITFNSTTGAIGLSANTDQITEGTTNLFFTQARARAALSASGAITYNSGTGAIGFSGVSSFNGRTGAVVPASGDYTSDQTTEGSTNLYFTNSRAIAAFSAGSGISLSSGVIANTSPGFTYDQQAVPSSPSNGQSWRERDASGNIVMDWEYIGSASAWRSLATLQASYSSNNIGSNTTQVIPGSLLSGNGYSIYFDRFVVNNLVATTNDASNYYTIRFQNQIGTATNNLGSLYSTAPNTASVAYMTVISLSTLVAENSLLGAKLSVTKVGAPGTLSAYSTLFYRYQRP